VTLVQVLGSSKRLVERAEHHFKHNVKGAMETIDRVDKGPRVLGDSGSDPGMRQLKQQSTAGPQEDDCFSIDPPSQRGWAQNASTDPAAPARTKSRAKPRSVLETT
jgi:hypothetical protein